jgi:hypothetical protein
MTNLRMLDAIGEFKHSVWRIVTFDDAHTGTYGYLLSDTQVDEIADEAAELVKGAVAAERERIRQLATTVEATYRPDDPDLPAITGQPGTKPGPDPLGDPFAELLTEGDPT